jgi:hypothetical protein
MINDSMNYKRITIFAKDTQNDMKRFIGHTILILLAEIFLFCPITMSQNNPYKINDQLYSYYQKCNSAIRKPEVLLMADTLFHMAKKTKTQPKARKTITSNNLADLSKLVQALEIDDENPENQQKPSALDKKIIYNEFQNSTYTLVSPMAYLIGIDKENFGEENARQFLLKSYEELDAHKEARIIRNLCRIRTAMERNYPAIVSEFRMSFRNIGSVPNLIPSEAVAQLEQDGVRIYKAKPDIDEYIISINCEISNRINQVARFFPEWVKWDYVKPIFLMPNGTKKDGIKKAGEYYKSDTRRYPFHCWINWDAVATSPESKGNILYNDEKFVTILYERHEDRFENLSLVRDAGNHTMRNLGRLLEQCKKCLIAVDCENSDAVKLAAALSSLPTEQLGKISKVILFDSEYTTAQWKTLVDRTLSTAVDEKANLELEHIKVERLNQNKSQCDMALAVRTSREVYTSGVDAVILVSSDSDYWAMIHQLDSVRFLVMLEKGKTGMAIMDTLARHEIPFCFIDDFCTAASYNIKTSTLINAIQEQINQQLAGESTKPFNVREMMETALQNSWIMMTDKEKEAFYKRYLLCMKLNVSPDGAVSITLG